MTREIPVLIKRLHADAVIPKYATDGAAGFDLVAVEDVVIEPGATALVKTGLAVALPPGYEIQIRPRSGISLKTKLRVANAPGTIDADYRGEIGVVVENTDDYGVRDEVWFGKTIEGDRRRIDVITGGKQVQHGTYLIRKGDRIAQAVIAELPRAVFTEVDSLVETERGEGGFGSTGVGLYDIGAETDGQLAFDFPIRPEVSE